MKKTDGKLILANGKVFEGVLFGSKTEVYAELVFNTSVVGYQEILTDPSYNQQIVVMTFPSQGIYGINDFNNQSNKIEVSGFVVNRLIKKYTNHYGTKSLNQFLKDNGVAGISEIPVRDIARMIREYGSIPGAITNIETDEQEVIQKLKKINFTNHVEKLQRNKVEILNEKGKRGTILFYDLGAKKEIFNDFINEGFKIIKVPFNTKYEELSKYKYDGIFFSNGPGDPRDLSKLVIEVKKMIQNNEKIVGICLGHQIIGLAMGLEIEKLKFGHHSTNHPVKDLINDKVILTSQNHNYSLKNKTKKNSDILAFVSLNDNSNEGIYLEDRIFSVQFHPEASPGPGEGKYIFKMFVKFLQGVKWKKKKF